MKETIKKIACAALCAVMLFCMALPAFADRSTSFAHTTMHNGAQVYRQGSISGYTVTASITLSFLPNVNHFPPSDYSTGIKIDGYSYSAAYLGYASTPVCGMYCSCVYQPDIKTILWYADCGFYLDPTSNFITLPADYTDRVSN